MKRKGTLFDVSIRISLLVCAALAAASVVPQCAYAQQKKHASNLVEALYYTNIARAHFGLQGLAPAGGLEPWNQSWEALQQAAFNHARDMAERGYFSHVSPEGWGPGLRLEGLGYRNAWAENIYCGSERAGDALAGWMNSAGHRQNILNPGFSKVGIAHYFNPTSPCGHYWVMVLGR